MTLFTVRLTNTDMFLAVRKDGSYFFTNRLHQFMKLYGAEEDAQKIVDGLIAKSERADPNSTFYEMIIRHGLNVQKITIIY